MADFFSWGDGERNLEILALSDGAGVEITVSLDKGDEDTYEDEAYSIQLPLAAVERLRAYLASTLP